MIRSGLIARVSPEFERFLNRNILGIDIAPDYWPRPRDISSLPVPHGIAIDDDAGEGWILEREFHPRLPGRRSILGSQGYRFARNREFNCGWRLVDVAARFLQAKSVVDFAGVTIVPPPSVFGANEVLPWLALRLASELDAAYMPDLFSAACPLAAHPDVATHLPVGATNVFALAEQTRVHLNGVHVLLVDWRFHTGRTLRSLAGQLRRRGAEVTRLVWLT